MFRAMVMALWLEKKENTIKGDQCNSAKDPPTVMSVFFIEHKDGKLCMVNLSFGECDLIIL